MSMQNDISDLSPSSINGGGALSLPVRTEKTILSIPNPEASVDPDYHIAAAKKAYRDYVTIRLPGRGGTTPGIFNANPATYRFLINPSEVEVQRQTIDQQSFTRAGWQIGLWGEDFLSISMSGKTPGKYFGNGLTDAYTPLTESYRNTLALELVFENNGYWFEGEASASKLDVAVKRIKSHQDVELTVGEFVWYGMFETMEITEDADSPFLSDFSLTFIAWREEYRRGTPYINPIGGEIQRGHVPFPGLGAPPQLPATIATHNADLTSYITHPDTGNWTIS